jgi:hypothetical protein
VIGFTGSQGSQGELGFTGSRGYIGSTGPNAIGQGLISQEQASDGSVLVYGESINTWAPTTRLDSQTLEGGFF